MSKYREIFLTDVRRNVLIDMCRAVVHGYRSAYQYCLEDFAEQQAFSLFPQVRWAMIERNLMSALPRHRDIDVHAHLNKSKNHHHVRVVSGRVVLTANAVAMPTTIVREADFRKTLVDSGQLELYGPNPLPPPDALLYAILLHGPSRTPITQPEFISVAFPGRDCEYYVETFDLLDELNPERALVFGQQVEDVPAPVVPLRPIEIVSSDE